MFTHDTMNNLRRRCSLPGDQRSRRWQIKTAFTGRRYLVRNLDTGKYRVVPRDGMHSLY